MEQARTQLEQTKQSTETKPAPAAAACCGATEQATCCETSEKSACCGTPDPEVQAPTRCGCR